MPIVPNLTKRLLARGELAIGVGVRQFRSVEIGLMARAAGFDFLFIDLEHSTMELSTAGEICAAALGQSVTPIVRVRGVEPFHCAALFDSGAQGVVVPHVRNHDEARLMVEAQKLPPLGARALSRSSALTGYENMAMADYVARANEETLTIAMVEDAEAVRNIDAILAVPGVDAILIGASDLCADLGLPGRFTDPRAIEACEVILRACAAKGTPSGVSGVRDDALLKRYVDQGARLIHAGTDAPILVEAMTRRASSLRTLRTSER
jgi:2-keto-3-deoxy-L-rhamnonate aldolase RhmA